RLILFFIRQLRQPEIQRFDETIFAPEHDVFRLDVSMHNLAAVRCVERGGDLYSDVKRLFNLKTGRLQFTAQCLALYELGSDKARVASASDFMNGNDVRVIESRGRPGLLLKTAQALAVVC